MSGHILESAADVLDEARAKIAQTRQALERALEGSGDARVREAVARLERMEADVERMAVIQAGAVTGWSATHQPRRFPPLRTPPSRTCPADRGHPPAS
jgi:hypothetical protein